jgi:hypothetical protein
MSVPLVFFQEPHNTIQCARLVLNLYQKRSTMHSWLCRSSLKSVEIWTDGCFCVCCKICITALNMWEEARKCCTPFTYVSSVGLEKMIKALESDQASSLLHHTRLYSHVQNKPRTFYVCSPRVPPKIIQLLLMCQTCPQPLSKLTIHAIMAVSAEHQNCPTVDFIAVILRSQVHHGHGNQEYERVRGSLKRTLRHIHVSCLPSLPGKNIRSCSE